MSSQTTHRPGFFKQPNKSHKTGRHRSKGSLSTEAKGKTEVTVISRKRKAPLSKQDKKNQHGQIKKQKIEGTLQLKRNRGVAGSAPFLVVVLPSVQTYNLFDELVLLLENHDDVCITRSERSGVVVCSRFKQRFEFVFPSTLEGYINSAKLADCLMIGVNIDAAGEAPVDEFALDCITCLYHQGLSSVVLTCQGLDGVPIKKQSETKKGVLHMFVDRFPELKVHPLDSDQDGILLLRTIGSQKCCRSLYNDCRPNLFASEINFVPSEDGGSSKLELTGYLRDSNLSANQLVHIPGHGNFQISTILGPINPHPIVNNSKKQRLDNSCDMEPVEVLQKSDPDKQESLEMEQEVNHMDNEQTWPTQEELDEAEKRFKMNRSIKKTVPKGFSEYQAAWYGDDEEEEEEEEADEGEDMDHCTSDEDEDDDDGEDNEMECDESEDESNQPADADEEVIGSEMDKMSVTNELDDASYDVRFDVEEDKRALQAFKEARMQEMFPDEIDTPVDVAARVRFQKYRGLKSFRTSPWDHDEELPADYEKIVKFKDFKVMKKRILQQIKDEEKTEDKVKSGTYITISACVNDPTRIAELVRSQDPIVAYGLLPFEQKITVVHFVIRRCAGDTDIIKSKDPMIFHVGCHRFQCRPVYSQHTKGPKHKYERFFPPGSTLVASIYAPIIFPPASVLMFKSTKSGKKLVGTGSLLSANPDRMIIKKISLSGHPFKINKKSAVLRYMFFNREDVEWFKPVELKTKNGYRGHIKEALGTHGHMKCIFDHQLNSQDVVLMNLYKRVYPKWTDFNLEQS